MGLVNDWGSSDIEPGFSSAGGRKYFVTVKTVFTGQDDKLGFKPNDDFITGMFVNFKRFANATNLGTTFRSGQEYTLFMIELRAGDQTERLFKEYSKRLRVAIAYPQSIPAYLAMPYKAN